MQASGGQIEQGNVTPPTSAESGLVVVANCELTAEEKAEAQLEPQSELIKPIEGIDGARTELPPKDPVSTGTASIAEGSLKAEHAKEAKPVGMDDPRPEGPLKSTVKEEAVAPAGSESGFTTANLDSQRESGFTLPVDSTVIKDAISALVTPETAGSLTRRLVRESLEERLGLASGSLEGQKDEISALLNEHLAWLRRQRGDSVNPQKEAAPPASTESPETTSAKRRRVLVKGEGGASEEEPESARGGKSQEKATPRQPGMRKQQASIMTRDYFSEHAQPLVSNLGPVAFTAEPRQFSTGSCGWFYGTKEELAIGDKKVMCQVTVNCTVLGSKTWKQGSSKSKSKSNSKKRKQRDSSDESD